MQLLPHDKVDIDYIHQDAIGGVIALGLAELYMKRPDKPIEYLAKWLLDYEQN